MGEGRDLSVYGELSLLKAVLQFAIIDAHGFWPATRDKARDWLLDDNPATECKFTFLYICEALDLCPKTVRRNALELSDIPIALRKSHHSHDKTIRRIYDPNPKGMPPCAVNYYGWK